MNKYYSAYRSSTTAEKHRSRDSHILALQRQFEFNYARFLPSDKNLRVVDLGCGAGELIHWLQCAGYFNVAGYDISEEQISEARRSFNGDFFCVNLLDKDFEFPTADVYFLRDVLEHFDSEEIELFFNKISECSSNGATLIIQTANGSSRHGVVTFFSDYTHKTLFTERSLAQVIKTSLRAKADFYPWFPVGRKGVSILKVYLIYFFCQFEKIAAAINIGLGNQIFTSNFIAVIDIPEEKVI